MEFKKIEKISEGKFINRYDLTYILSNGQEKVYEIISREKEIDSFEQLRESRVAAVVMIMHDETGEKVLLNKEYRLSTGGYVYSFPAGLIEPGENPEEGARRELWEETGLQMVRIDDWIHESYSAPGFSNEKNVCVVGVADGTFAASTSPEEEIEPGWYTKSEVRELLRTQPFAARTQAYCYVWSKEA